MSKRKALSKKIRFEVLKRDKFTCKWCGKSAVQDDVILEIDHIVPVKEGGDNHILNLVTSCFDCNRGKGANRIDDNTVIAQQKKQLDSLQDRKEQLDLMFRWHQELQGIDTEKNIKVFQYVNDIMVSRSLNSKGETDLAKLTKKYELKDLLMAIDLSAEKYLRYDKDNELTAECATEFLKKIGGILYNMKQPIMFQKSSYIKGICKNRFDHFNVQVGSILLKNYTEALDIAGWSEERIINDLEDEVIPFSKEAKNWTQWRNQIERWVEDIRGWNLEKSNEEVAPN